MADQAPALGETMSSKRRRSAAVATESKRSKDTAASSDNEEDVTITQCSPDFAYESSKDEPEAGLIERISLRNFMCHDRLTVPIGNHVNFIIGKNGSGKSAVMTAVVVGLGGKATATNRGSSIKGFIKTGKTTADISISLRNQGDDAYKHDTYGDTITVERRLGDGKHPYTIKNVEGKVISHKKEDLLAILDQFNIQVDNPVSLLNQETSKSFLNSKSPKDKYKFFLKATQLEQMRTDYLTANDQKAKSKELLHHKQQTLPELELKVLAAEQKYKALEAVDELREKVKRLRNEMAWALVTEKERGLDPIAKELRREEERTPKYQKKCDEFQEKIKRATDEFKAIQEEMKEFSEDAQPLSARHDQARNTRDDKKKLVRAAQRELSSAVNELKSIGKDKQQVEEKLHELKSVAENDYSEQRAAREQKIAELEAAIVALQAQQTTTQHSYDQFQHAVSRANETLYAANAEVGDLSQRQEQARRNLRNMESTRSNKMRRFGQHMPELLRKIDEAHRQKKFHQKPRGPIGASLTLSEHCWAAATEMCLKSLLHSFCCNDHHDAQQLERICKQACPSGKSPTIIVSKFRDEVYDVRQHRAQGDYPTLFDLIQTDDPVVSNCLIDQRSIENVLMFKDAKTGREVMLKRPPQKAREAFTMSGDQLFAAPNFRYYSNRNAKANVLTVNLEDNIKQATDEVNNLEHEIAEKKRANKQHQLSVKDNQQQAKGAQNTLTAIRNKLNQHTYELTELRNMEDPAPEGDIAMLEEDSRQIESQMKVYQKKVEELQGKYRAVKTESEAADAAFTKAHDELQSYAERSTEIKDRLAKSEKAIDDSKYHNRHYADKKKEHDSKVEELRKQKEGYEKEIASSVAKAEQICARIKTRRTANNLESEINQINKRITVEEKTRESRDEITRTYFEKLEAYKKIKKEVGQLDKFLTKLEEVMQEREKAYAEFRRMISTRAKYFFIAMLSNRQYTGKMIFNHKEEQLALFVQPTAAHNQSKDMRALSGGERSFSTVCFILSLWSTIESPFRMLDEFDVFMDMVNRRIAMDLMMEAAKKTPNRQYVFLTPLDMSYVRQPTVKIFEMYAPERGQTTLPFDRKRGREVTNGEEEEIEEET